MLRLRLREVREPASTSQPGSCKSDLAHACDSKAVALNHRAPLSLPEPPPPQLDGCRLGPGLTAPEQLGVGVPSPADAAAGEGRLLGGSVGEFPEAAARLPLHRRPTLRQAEEDISGVSVCRGAGGGQTLPPHRAPQQPGAICIFFSLLKNVLINFILLHSLFLKINHGFNYKDNTGKLQGKKNPSPTRT